MSDLDLNIYSAIGIVLTFIVSSVSLVFSYLSLKEAKKARESNLLSSARLQWQYTFRDKSSEYMTNVVKMCNSNDDNCDKNHVEFISSHYSLKLLLFSGDKEVQDTMSIIRDSIDRIFISKEMKSEKEISEMKNAILTSYIPDIEKKINKMIENEWDHTYYDITGKKR